MVRKKKKTPVADPGSFSDIPDPGIPTSPIPSMGSLHPSSLFANTTIDYLKQTPVLPHLLQISQSVPNVIPSGVKKTNVLKYDVTYTHVIHNLLNIQMNSGTDRSLIDSCCFSAYDLASFADYYINNLDYTALTENGNKVLTSIPSYHKNALRLMRDYIKFLHTQNNGLLLADDILAITKQDWDSYRISVPMGSSPQSFTSVTPASSATNSFYDQNHYNELQNFYEGIECTKLDYNIIKDVKYFFSWRRTFLATARTHRISEVFNPEYRPKDTNEEELFDAKQGFAYVVLDYVLQTERGRYLVIKYEESYDAQRIWEEFVDYAQSSMNQNCHDGYAQKKY